MKNLLLLLFALIAAVGNAMFAAGQKKAAGLDNSLLFIGFSATVCLILTFLVLPLIYGKFDIISPLSENWKWILLSGSGLFLTYLGFNLLYRHFGTSAYVYYAVLSIITTSVIVGIVIFREKVNIYHAASIILAIGAIILYTIGNNGSR